jgi:antigen flippase
MLKATSVVAGAKVATILVSVVRMKAVASLLGPSGMGLVNLVSSSVDLTRVITNLGVDSGVIRTISTSYAENNLLKIRVTYHVAVRTALVVGMVGWLLVSITSPWLSLAATGNMDKAWLFVLGGASLVFSHLLGVQLALLQGMRKIRALATCQLLTSPLATAVSVLLIFLYGETGGVVALTATTLTSLLVHLKFVGKHRPQISLPLSIPYWEIIRNNLKDGSGFAINALWLTTSGWLNLLLIRHFYGEDGTFHVGMFSAASMLANFYVSIVISALGTEFFPSLSAESGAPDNMRKLLNNQAILALDAGVVASLILMVTAPWVLTLLYSAKFSPAADLMRLLLFGSAIRFAAFPLGFVILALGRSKLFAQCELAMGLMTITLSCVFIPQFGLMGLGIAFISANFVQAAGLWLLTRKLNVSWDRTTQRAVIGALVCLALVLGISFLEKSIYGLLAASAIVTVYGWVAAWRIQRSSGLTLFSLLQKFRRESVT